MMLEKTIEIDDRFGKEYSGKYKFCSISWGTSNRLTDECTTIVPGAKKTIVDLQKLQAKMLDATLVERPKAITFESLMEPNGIPVVLGELLMGIADQVNGYGEGDRAALKKLRQRWGLE